MKIIGIVCLIFVLSMNIVFGHGIYQNIYNNDFESQINKNIYSKNYDEYDYNRIRHQDKYSDIIGNEFKINWNTKTVKDVENEYYFRFSKTFRRYQAVKCHNSAPEGKLFYIKC